jgi:hypothetical protein
MTVLPPCDAALPNIIHVMRVTDRGTFLRAAEDWKVRRRRAGRQEQLVFLVGNLAHGECDTGIGRSRLCAVPDPQTLNRSARACQDRGRNDGRLNTELLRSRCPFARPASCAASAPGSTAVTPLWSVARKVESSALTRGSRVSCLIRELKFLQLSDNRALSLPGDGDRQGLDSKECLYSQKLKP